MSVRVFDGPDALAEAAAALVKEMVDGTTLPFHLCLSGGSTPKKLYSILASPAFASDIPWDRVHFWWGDERFVPPTDDESNEKMARETMLSKVPVSESQIHPMYRPGSAADAAVAYERSLREFLPPGGFDLVLLGLGPDAHTASLFPGDPSIDEEEHWVVRSIGAAGVKERLTLTPPILNAARNVLFLVAGNDKAEPLKHVMNEPYEPQKFPAQIVARNARYVQWFLDSVAAAEL